MPSLFRVICLVGDGHKDTRLLSTKYKTAKNQLSMYQLCCLFIGVTVWILAMLHYYPITNHVQCILVCTEHNSPSFLIHQHPPTPIQAIPFCWTEREKRRRKNVFGRKLFCVSFFSSPSPSTPPKKNFQ